MRAASARVQYRENHLPACGETQWPILVRNRKCEPAPLPLENDLAFDNGHTGDFATVIARRGDQFPGRALYGQVEARASPSDNNLLHLAAIVQELTNEVQRRAKRVRCNAGLGRARAGLSPGSALLWLCHRELRTDAVEYCETEEAVLKRIEKCNGRGSESEQGRQRGEEDDWRHEHSSPSTPAVKCTQECSEPHSLICAGGHLLEELTCYDADQHCAEQKHAQSY